MLIYVTVHESKEISRESSVFLSSLFAPSKVQVHERPDVEFEYYSLKILIVIETLSLSSIELNFPPSCIIADTLPNEKKPKKHGRKIRN